MPNKSKDERITELEQEVAELRKERRKMAIDFLAHAQATSMFAKTMQNLQPVIGRLLTVAVVLEKKGAYTQEDIITEEEANKFIAKANPDFAKEHPDVHIENKTQETIPTPNSEGPAKEVPSESNAPRPVDGNHGDGSGELSGTPSAGVLVQGDFTPKGS